MQLIRSYYLTGYITVLLSNVKEYQTMFTENSSPSQRNLFERVFEALTAGQRERFAVDGSVQRSDSFQAMSNIANFGCLRLLVEVLRRLVRIFDDADNQRFQELIESYTAHMNFQMA